MQISDHLKGILITTLGVIILSPDAILIRLLYTDTITVLFWRGVALGIGIIILMSLVYRRDVLQQFIKIGKPGILIAIIFALSTLCFTTAIQNTSIANTLIIFGTSPMFAAFISWFFLKEKIKFRTWVAMFVIFASIFLIVSDNPQQGGLLGDICALGAALCMAINFSVMRHFKSINMIPAMGVSGFFIALATFPVIFLFDSPLLLRAEVVPYLVMAGFVITLAFALITVGPRYMPAPEVGLIMPLETVLGSYLGWIILKEEPSLLTIIGGLIVIATLTIHAWLSVQDSHE